MLIKIDFPDNNFLTVSNLNDSYRLIAVCSWNFINVLDVNNKQWIEYE